MSAVETHPGMPGQPRPEAPDHPHEGPEEPRAGGHHGRALTLLGVVAVVLSSLAIGGLAIAKHEKTKHAAAARAEEADRGPHVLVARAELSPGEHDFMLPAEARGYFQTTAYAKVSGYVREVRVDKGDRVTKGQILGIVESPETDQVVRGAQSDLALRRQLYARAKELAPNVMSLQDLQTATSNLNVSRSSMQSALALQSYETIRAPYDGIVTMRYVDPGALMPAATGSTTSAQPFVDVADPSRLRIDAYVGQDEALYIHAGDPVSISQDAGVSKVDATVTRTSGALDPRTRTMLCEVELDNAKGLLLPGAFSQITFHIRSEPHPRVPAEALLLRQGHEMLALVRDGRVHLANVQTGVTDGRTMQVVKGLRVGDMVALNVPAEVEDGDAVQATEKKPEPTDAGVPPPAK